MRLSEIRGHTAIRRLMARAVARDRLPPCLVLTGPDGVGKREVAGALAAVLNCDDVVVSAAETLESDGCGACDACRRISRGIHTDVSQIGPGDNGTIKVEAVRAVVDRAGFRPFEGRRRVVIIDEADRLVPEAQNALLKTLEEPPSASVFLLVTHRPHLLLPTVRSRCPELRFGGLAPEDVARILVDHHDVDPVTAQAAVATADGSVARALETGSDDHRRARETAAIVLRALAEAPPPRRRLQMSKDLATSGRGRSSSAVERDALTRRLQALGTLLRDLQVVSTDGDRNWLANADLEADLEELSSSYDIDRVSRGYGYVERAVSALTRNASPKVVADWLMLQI